MKIFRLTSISQWAYLIAVICFLLMVFWVSVTFKPPSSSIGMAAQPTVSEIAPSNTPSTPSLLPTNAPAETAPVKVEPTKNPDPTKDSRCIITIDGQRYDVSLFRRQHEGGDVFKCGSDMSKKFHEKHPAAFLTVLYPFRI